MLTPGACVLVEEGDGEPGAVNEALDALRAPSLRAFCDREARESWKGLDTSFRAGAKARLLGGDCNYGRLDFQEAWCRGWNAIDEALGRGATFAAPGLVPVAAPPRRRGYGTARVTGRQEALQDRPLSRSRALSRGSRSPGRPRKIAR